MKRKKVVYLIPVHWNVEKRILSTYNLPHFCLFSASASHFHWGLQTETRYIRLILNDKITPCAHHKYSFRDSCIRLSLSSLFMLIIHCNIVVILARHIIILHFIKEET